MLIELVEQILFLFTFLIRQKEKQISSSDLKYMKIENIFFINMVTVTKIY